MMIICDHNVLKSKQFSTESVIIAVDLCSTDVYDVEH